MKLFLANCLYIPVGTAKSLIDRKSVQNRLFILFFLKALIAANSLRLIVKLVTKKKVKEQA